MCFVLCVVPVNKKKHWELRCQNCLCDKQQQTSKHCPTHRIHVFIIICCWRIQLLRKICIIIKCGNFTLPTDITKTWSPFFYSFEKKKCRAKKSTIVFDTCHHFHYSSVSLSHILFSVLSVLSDDNDYRWRNYYYS